MKGRFGVKESQNINNVSHNIGSDYILVIKHASRSRHTDKSRHRTRSRHRSRHAVRSGHLVPLLRRHYCRCEIVVPVIRNTATQDVIVIIFNATVVTSIIASLWLEVFVVKLVISIGTKYLLNEKRKRRKKL